MRGGRLGVFLPLALAAAGRAAGFGSAGTAGADFLKIPSFTRPAGMAGAVAAGAMGLEAMEYNPARLSGVMGWELDAQHLAYFEGINIEQVSFGGGRPGLGAGLSVLSLSTPDIPMTDFSGAQTGTFKQQDLALSGGLGLGWGGFSVGALGRGLQRNLAGFSYSGAEADLGAAWSSGGLRLGAAAQHLGSLGALSQVADPSPMTFRGGLAWVHNNPTGLSFVGELDGVQSRDAAPQARLGVEAGLSYFFARAGTQVSSAYDGRQPFTLGLGVRLASWELNYAFADIQGLGTGHRFGLNWRLDGAYGGRKDLQAPRGLAMKKEGQNLLLTWDQAEHAAGYAVYLRKTKDGALARAGKTGAKQRQLRLKNAAKLPDLGLAVATLDGDGQESPLSDELRVKAGQEKAELFLAPQNLRVREEDGRKVLAWDGPPGEANFQVLASRRNGSNYAVLGRPTVKREMQLPADWKETRFVVVQALRVSDGEASALSKELEVKNR
jgi:hypothetical protein